MASRDAAPVHLLFQQYLERLQRRQAKPHTLTNFRRTATLWGQSGLDPMTAEDWQIEEWLAGLPLSPRTRRLHLENLSAAYRYAVHRRLLQVAPTETVKLPAIPDKEPNILTPDQLRWMLHNAPTDEHLLFLATFMFTGMRNSEVRNLKWEDISPTSIRTIGKGGKLRHVPLHPALGELIVRWPNEPESPYVFHGKQGKSKMQPRSPSSFFNILEACRGNIRCTLHDFRRTVATSLAENDVKERVIDEIMGWSARTVQNRYYVRNARREVQEAMLRLYANDPIRIL